MSELLSENEIDALMNGVGDKAAGKAKDFADEDFELYDLTSGIHRVQGWTEYVQIVDDRIRTALSIRLLGILHKTVEVKRDTVTIQKYEEYAKTLKLPTAIHCYSLTGMLGLSAIVLDADLVSALVNAFFGGGSRPTPIEGREFSHTEQRLINLIVTMIIEVIQENFREIADLEINVVETEMNPSHFSVYADSDVLMIRPFNIQFSGMGGAVQLIMPGSVVDAIFRHKTSRLAELGISSDKVLSAIAGEFTLGIAGVLPGASLTLKEVLDLNEGDIVNIASPDHVDVTVNGVPKLKARMGEVNGRVGLEIVRRGKRDGRSQ